MTMLDASSTVRHHRAPTPERHRVDRRTRDRLARVHDEREHDAGGDGHPLSLT